MSVGDLCLVPRVEGTMAWGTVVWCMLAWTVTFNLSESCYYGFPSESYNILDAFKWLKDHDQCQ